VWKYASLLGKGWGVSTGCALVGIGDTIWVVGGTNFRPFAVYPQQYPQELPTVEGNLGMKSASGNFGMYVTDFYRIRGWDLILVVRSVTWLNRLRRSAMR
jgi:hypothetical protein